MTNSLSMFGGWGLDFRTLVGSSVCRIIGECRSFERVAMVLFGNIEFFFDMVLEGSDQKFSVNLNDPNELKRLYRASDHSAVEG